MRQDCFDELIERDIGMRALVYAFAALKETRDSFANKTGSWKNHAEWFVPKINAVYKAGWFRKYSELDKEQSKILTHICFDAAGSIVNYKISDIPRALGALMALLVAREGLKEFSAEQRAELWDTFGDALDGALRRGFRKEQRARLRDSFTGTQPEFIAEVNKRADKNVVDRLKLIQSKVIDV